MSEPTAEFAQAHADLGEALKLGIKAFADWTAKYWKMAATREQWEKETSDPFPGDDYLRGYNAGVESVTDAFEAFAEEHY